jgi:iron complex transport system substrate-binding protein
MGSVGGVALDQSEFVHTERSAMTKRLYSTTPGRSPRRRSGPFVERILMHAVPRSRRRQTGILRVGVLAGVIGAGGSLLIGSWPGQASAATTAPAYPVTVSNCGTATTYNSAPTRAVSNDINTTEDMVALGLGPSMVGDFGVNGSLASGQRIPQQYQAGFSKVKNVSSDYFTLEKLVSLHPDFLFAGWNYGLQVGTNLTPENLSIYGINTLVLTESCAHVQPDKAAITIGDTYQDLRNLGVIFNVRNRANKLVGHMQAQVSAANNRVKKLKPVTVFDYDSGTSAPFTGPGLAMPNALITLGGGTNIFAGLKQSWTSVSWEQVVKANPQCIIINDYGTPTAKQKEKFLETSPITKKLAAVKNHCFLALSYDQVTPSPRNAGAVVSIAHWLHPKAFGLPADGS